MTDLDRLLALNSLSIGLGKDKQITPKEWKEQYQEEYDSLKKQIEGAIGISESFRVDYDKDGNITKQPLKEIIEKAELWDSIDVKKFVDNKTLQSQIKSLSEENNIIKEINQTMLESDFESAFKQENTKLKQNPKLCPVCLGTKTVPVDFYNKLGSSTSVSPIRCETCLGVGILDSALPEIQNLKPQLEQNNIIKSRYFILQDMYLNSNEKHFGETCSLYFDDEPIKEEA